MTTHPPHTLTVAAVRAEAHDIFAVDVSSYTDADIRTAISQAPRAGGWSLDNWEDWDGRKRIALELLLGRKLT